jgi:hypothetical protein
MIARLGGALPSLACPDVPGWCSRTLCTDGGKSASMRYLCRPVPSTAQSFRTAVFSRRCNAKLCCRCVDIKVCVCLLDLCITAVDQSRPKALQVPTWSSSHETKSTNQHMQLASAHSKVRYQQKPTLQSAEDIASARVHDLLRHFSTSCIGCWLCEKQSYQDHQFKNCRASPSRLTRAADWEQWYRHLHLPEGFCYKCGCIQKVSSFPVKPSS